ALVALVATDAVAQRSRFEIVPQVGYSFGGGRDFDGFTDGGVSFPSGKFVLDPSLSWGVTAAFLSGTGGAFTVHYQRQDTDLGIEWDRTPPNPPVTNANATTGFANNYVIFGYRQDFARSRSQRLVPYIGGGLGFNIMDAKDINESETYFSLSAHGGIRYMFANGSRPSRFGIQLDMRGLWTFVPSGDVGIYCNWWGYCYAYEGSATVAQGTVSGGLVIKF
ncbi:MAG: hypothetical protein MUC69_03700, partial [Gemmatimonadales bacterium]|nr:hypothetical protein [Gemmatimonadales bacterium]